MKKQTQQFILLAFAGAALSLFFQNCTPSKFDSDSTGKLFRSGNGGPYAGKIGEYRSYSLTEPCSARDASGKALPNDIVLIKAGSDGVVGPYLARESCLDRNEPLALAQDEVKYDEASGTLSYRDRTFSNSDPHGEFDIVAASCPVGKTEIPQALRKNIFVSPFNWTALGMLQPGMTWSPGWYHHEGISVNLYSTLSSLPAYLIQRTDPNLLDEWRRSLQSGFVQANTEYSFTFLASGASLNAADFTFYRGWTGIAGDLRNEEVVLTFDFQNQSVRTVRNTNVSGVSARITPLGNGYLCTVYLTTSTTANQTESSFGVTPSALNQSTGKIGDSIVATAAQLVPVNEFCR